MNPLLIGVSTDPWMRHALLGLFRHRRRHLWVAGVLRDQMGVDLDALARGGALAHPRHIPPKGDLPGLHGWQYYFHGRGCAFECRRTGEHLDVDFYDGSGEDFEPCFYTNYLRSLRTPERPEARLIDLHPSVDTVRVTMQALAERRILFVRDPRWPKYRLNAEILEDEEALGALPDSVTAESLSARMAWLRARVLHGNAVDVVAYAELGPPDLDVVLDEVLAGPLSPCTAGALKVVEARKLATDSARVRALLARLDPSGPIPQPWLWERATEWLRVHSAG